MQGSICAGDSLNSKQPALERFVEKLQWWFRARFSGEFRNDGPNLPHDLQKDRTSCALFTINAIEHNVFGNTLGVAHPARERARWFFLTAESQINGSAEPSHTDRPNTNALPLGERALHGYAGPSHTDHPDTNALSLGERALHGRAGPSHTNHPNTNASPLGERVLHGHAGPSHANHFNTDALPLGERALKPQAEEHTHRIQGKIFLEVKQELEETERIDRERMAHGKAETVGMELGGLEHKSHGRARQGREGLEMFHQDPRAHVNNDIEDIQMRDVDTRVTSMIIPPEDQSMRLKPAEELNYPRAFITICCI